MDIRLSPSLADYVRAKVATGDYATESDVLGAALRLMQAQEEAHATTSAILRRLIAEGEASGIAEDFSFAKLAEDLDREIDPAGLPR